LGKPVIVGPWTQNFADAVRQLAQADAIITVAGGGEVAAAVAGVLADPAAAADRGRRAQAVVRGQQGRRPGTSR
jgi:3-deoxy-D-manno-octulosonic-acid transferase